MIATEAENKLVEEVAAMIQGISQRVQGMRVRMRGGKYDGRVATLEGAIFNHDGRVAYLCMVERADGAGPINGDCASRSYLPDTRFEVFEEEGDA